METKERPLDEIVMKDGTLIKVEGLPFVLKDDTIVLGQNVNAEEVARLRRLPTVERRAK